MQGLLEIAIMASAVAACFGACSRRVADPAQRSGALAAFASAAAVLALFAISVLFSTAGSLWPWFALAFASVPPAAYALAARSWAPPVRIRRGGRAPSRARVEPPVRMPGRIPPAKGGPEPGGTASGASAAAAWAAVPAACARPVPERREAPAAARAEEPRPAAPAPLRPRPAPSAAEPEPPAAPAPAFEYPPLPPRRTAPREGAVGGAARDEGPSGGCAPDLERMLSKAALLKSKGAHAAAARLYAECAEEAPDGPAGTRALAGAMACLVRAGDAGAAREAALRLDARRSDLAPGQALKVDAVLKVKEVGHGQEEGVRAGS